MNNLKLAALCLAVGTSTAAIFSCAPALPLQPTMSTSPTTSAVPSSSGTTTPTTTPSSGSSTTPSNGPSASASTGTSDYKQVERLARPAINEGLITVDALLNTWNSVPPTVDLTSAAAPIAAEATRTLKALGNNDTQVAALFGALLPDVMRIDTTVVSGYAGTAGAPLGNLEPTTHIPVGGRMIKDDVIDATLFLIVPDATANAVSGLRSDNVGYDTPDATGHKHKPVMTAFPYAPLPN